MDDQHIYACICEGGAERVIINKLLDENRLIFDRDNLLEQELLRCRSAKDFEQKHLSKGFTKKITLFRINDSKREKFNLSAAYKDKVDVENIITSPEIEMLVIIGENKYSDYQKYKSNMKPSEYCKRVLHYPEVKKERFLLKYFEDTDKLIAVIKEYSRLSHRNSNEKCLADLLK